MGDRTEIAISFDTTSSMSHCIKTVRGNLDQNIRRVLEQHPSTRFAIIAHGDYCDRASKYVTKEINFTNDLQNLRSFVDSVEDTHGGDTDECYELVLRKVRTELSWTPGSKRAYVLIGDYDPHPPEYPHNVDHIDWRQEIQGLAIMGIRGYAVHCEKDGLSQEMYKTLASQTGGVYLRLSDLANISDALVAICKHRQGPAHLQEYENEVRTRSDDVHPDMDAILRTLRQQTS